ncbi:unnamed protein product [Haemonchus placei]|uniref:Transposase n=1 Tax=Haemonchus placei TaxID=6290 RepID=A0A0N4X5T4_HAEPC|nr:unnamed protein product [Haemonchus placei]
MISSYQDIKAEIPFERNVKCHLVIPTEKNSRSTTKYHQKGYGVNAKHLSRHLSEGERKNRKRLSEIE